MYTTLTQRRLRWLGHVRRMDDKRIPKVLLYGELVNGKRNIGRPRLRYKDVCKRDLKKLNIGLDEWEDLADNRNEWRSLISQRLSKKE